jgi:hypothetical protein
MKTVSVTELTQYFRCQREYYLERVLKIKGAPYLPFIVGNAVHQFIAYWLHKETPEGRTFFYKTEESAIKGFRLFFLREVWPKYASAFSEKEEWQALNIGIGNVKSYMRISAEKGIPMYIEKKLSFPVQNLNCELTGTIDQIRRTNPEWAKKHGLPPGGVVLVDLKTGKPQYEILGRYNDQIDLVNNIQATMYWFLYRNVFGTPPDAVAFWFLGGKKGSIVTTTREERDEKDMLDIVSNFIRSISSKVKSSSNPEEWPKTPNVYQCKFCRHSAACYPEIKARLSAPITDDDDLPFGVSNVSAPAEGKPYNIQGGEQPTLPRILRGIPRKKADAPWEKDKGLVEKYETLMEEKEETKEKKEKM